jgi:isopenicillin-N epimerase
MRGIGSESLHAAYCGVMRILERRDFVRLASFAALGGMPGEFLSRPEDFFEITSVGDSNVAAKDEQFWARIRKSYVTSPSLIDLDNANTAPAPRSTFDAYVARARKLRQAPSEGFSKMWIEADATARARLAQYLGVDPTQLAITPNSTYGLNTVLHGFPLERGDEILITNHEYPDMVETVLQRSKRDGIVVRKVEVPRPDESGTVLVARTVDAIGPRTKLLLISHVSAWSGEVLPVSEVTKAARAKGVAVLVDAAQSVGLLDVSFANIGSDFLATSLHKWLAAPMGTGALIMRPEHVGKVWPLNPPSWDTSKYPMDVYEWTGTFNVAAYASIVEALEFHHLIGAERKRARIRYLGDYWQTKLAAVPGARLLTPKEPSRSLGVASFMLDNVPAAKLVSHLRTKGIIVQDKSSRHSPFSNAVRVSHGVYTTPEELDRFVDAVTLAARKGAA